MTEPTRDAQVLDLLKILPTQFGHYGDQLTAAEGDLLAHAAECVKRVPELEAEVERLRAKAAIVDAIDGGEVTHEQAVLSSGVMEHRLRWRNGGTSYGPTIAAAYAAATREGTSDGN